MWFFTSIGSKDWNLNFCYNNFKVFMIDRLEIYLDRMLIIMKLNFPSDWQSCWRFGEKTKFCVNAKWKWFEEKKTLQWTTFSVRHNIISSSKLIDEVVLNHFKTFSACLLSHWKSFGKILSQLSDLSLLESFQSECLSFCPKDVQPTRRMKEKFVLFLFNL